MKKLYQATRKGNKWVRKTKWELEAEDCIGFVICVLVLGYVVVRVLLG